MLGEIILLNIDQWLLHRVNFGILTLIFGLYPI